MVDLVDMAEEFRAKELQNSIAARPQFHGESEYECIECGEGIPAQRRALGGVTHCISCQEYIEAKNKHLRG